MKKIDKLLLKGFFGPFAVAFGVALFVLIMQFLWLYIDEIAGKGVSLLVLFELLGYLSVSVFPMAFPIAVLISSVMVLGGMSEKYELSSLKSAGIPLLRVIRSLILVSVGVAFFSWICSNWLIPASNLQFKSRLYDIRKAKPALSLEPGVFNEDFRNFTIRIGQKSRDGETIGQVLLHDASQQGRNDYSQILADSGRMWTTNDKRFFVMNLFRGTQYQSPTASGKRKYPFIRTSFSSYRKVWDMKEFDLSASDPEGFKDHRSMLTMAQLAGRVDSLNREITRTSDEFGKDILRKTGWIDSASIRPTAPRSETWLKDEARRTETFKRDSIQRSEVSKIQNTAENGKKTPAKRSEILAKKVKINPRPEAHLGQQKSQIPAQKLEKPVGEHQNWLQTLPFESRAGLAQSASTLVSANRTTLQARSRSIDRYREEAIKTAYELYSKYSFALVCIVFLFIGAPLGAIIRKGGFGWPVLVSIGFFMVFISLTIACRRLADSRTLEPFWAAMVPIFVLLPVGFWLTRKAMNDSLQWTLPRFSMPKRILFFKRKA